MYTYITMHVHVYMFHRKVFSKILNSKFLKFKFKKFENAPRKGNICLFLEKTLYLQPPTSLMS